MSWIVVTGLPASGKSTVGRALAAATGRPILDKDDFLEALFLPEGSADAALRSTLSRQADLAFAEAARDQPDAVLVSFWRRPELSPTAGTPTDWLQDDAGLVEVHCRCSIETALHRFTTRSRHSVHGDVHRTVEQLTMQFSSLAALGPLGIGRLVEVDTAAAFDIDEIVTALEPSRRT